MAPVTRRQFMEMAAAFGASPAWSDADAPRSTAHWREQRQLYPQGVADGESRG